MDSELSLRHDDDDDDDDDDVILSNNLQAILLFQVNVIDKPLHMFMFSSILDRIVIIFKLRYLTHKLDYNKYYRFGSKCVLVNLGAMTKKG